MKLLLDEMYSERVAESLRGRGHDATHVREIGLGGAPDAEVLTRAAEEGRTLVTENAADFLPLLDQRQSAGLPMTPVLIALTADRGTGGSLHAKLADAVGQWATERPTPYAHAHWLP